nr:CNT_HP1_G0033190.mRNA.1.CDS.1 [Saccharomyces cerevisiae]
MIVEFRNLQKKAKVSDRRKFGKQTLTSLESALNNKTTWPLSALTLFEWIPTEVRSFTKTKSLNWCNWIGKVFWKIVVSVSSGKCTKVPDVCLKTEPDFQATNPFKVSYSQENQLMVYTLFQVHTLKCHRKDYDTLSLCSATG